MMKTSLSGTESGMRIQAVFTSLLLSLCLSLVAAETRAGPYDDLLENLVPHKALYDIEMVSKSSGSQVVNISGQMFYEWRPECDAFTTDHRFNLFYEYADSPPFRITSDFSTYETVDGKSFDYTSRRKRNGELFQEIRGRAEFSGEGKGEAVYSKPDGLVFDLDQKTLFPMAHSLEVIKKAREGVKFYNARIFDGSDEDGPVEVNTFIGKRVNSFEPDNLSEQVDRELILGSGWKVRMAFFPVIESESDAQHEMDVIFHENGIISDMLVEYRDFSVTQKLVALERIAGSGKCDEEMDE
jgi:hypothetical protein